MPIALIENFRAVFYVPFYAAFALKAYEHEGIEVRLQASPAADQTLTTLQSGGGQVSWGGPMRLLHAHDADRGSNLVGFCEVVGRDPFYLLGREPKPNFHLRDLIGKRLAVVSEVPTPWYCLQHDLRLAGVALAGIDIADARGMAANAARLAAGEVDVIQVFEPFAHNLVEQGIGHRWYAGASRGPTTYTTLNTTRELIAREPGTPLKMTRAMYRTQQWIAAHDGRALAALVASYFPDIPEAVLAACCDGYKATGVWNTDPVQQRAGLEWLRDAMIGCGAIRSPIRYEDVADVRFAQQVIAEA